MSASAGHAPRVGVVVVHFGELTPTEACVRSLRQDSSPCDRRIVAVDNSGDVLPGALPGAEVLRTGRNAGFGGGANLGVGLLGGGPWDALVILNNDVEVADGYLDAAVAALSHPGVALAGGPLYLDKPGGVLWYAGGEVNCLTGTVRQAKSPRAATRRRTAGFSPGAAFAARAEAWHQVGGFDSSYFLYNEDLDFCLRLRRRGWRLLYDPAMVAVHHLGTVTGSGARSPLYLEHMAATRLRPFRPLAYRAYLAVLHSGYVVLRALRYRVMVRGEAGRQAAGALLRGHAKALRSLRRAPRDPA
jgi:GT2 family glycosyltransferase